MWCSLGLWSCKIQELRILEVPKFRKLKFKPSSSRIWKFWELSSSKAWRF
jgi:hypothetical protein